VETTGVFSGKPASSGAISRAIAWSALPAAALSLVSATSLQAMASSASAGSVRAATARVQALLDNPLNGTVNLPSGTFAVSPKLRLHQGVKVVGHHTTLKVANHSGDYAAMLAGASSATDLSGLTITGVTFDQNAAGNPIRSVAKLYHGVPRFVILVSRGSGVKIVHNRFSGTNNVNTIVTGGGTRNVTISGNVFAAIDTPWHDHSSVYTAGTSTTVSGNTFKGTAAIAAAIELHGSRAKVAGNRVNGYYRGVNIVADNTTFSHNKVIGAVSPVDLWSTVSPGLHHVNVTYNTLNRDLSYWSRFTTVPSSRYTKQVIKDPTSKYPLRSVTIRGNRG